MYATTDEFLKRFRLHDLAELPDYDKLMESVKQSDKYNKDTENIYRITDDDSDDGDKPTGSEEGEDVFFEELSDEKPDFLKEEDIVVVD